MDAYKICITIVAVACVGFIAFLLMKISKIKKSVEQVAADNLKRGKEDAADYIKSTIDKVEEDKNKLNEMSDRELMIEAVLALAGHGRRLDRMEEKLQGIYNYKAYTETLTEQIQKIAMLAVDLNTNIESTTSSVTGFKMMVDATRADVDKLNHSIADVENIKERIYVLIGNINNSTNELQGLNNKLVEINNKIQGIYEYKKYLDEIVMLVNKVKTLSETLASNITDNDAKTRSFNQTVQHAYSSVEKLNNSLADVESIKARVASAVENMNKSVYEMNYINGKITEIVTATNEVLKTYGDAPMVKLTHIETEIGKTQTAVALAANTVGSLVGNIEEIIEDNMCDMQDSVNEVKEVVYKVKEVVNEALGDAYEYEYDSIYRKISDVSDNISSLDSMVEDIKSAVGDVKSTVDRTLADEYAYDGVHSKVNDIARDIDEIDDKLDEIKSAIDNIGSGY